MPVDVDFLASAFGSAQKVAGPPVVPSAEPETDFLTKAFALAPVSKRLEFEKEKSRLQSEARGLDLANLLNPANLFKVQGTDLPVPEKTAEGGILPQIGLGITSGFAQIGQSGNKLLETLVRYGGGSIAPGIKEAAMEQFRGASEIAGQAAREVEQLGQITQGPDMVRTVSGGVVSMLPVMAAAPLGFPAAVTAVGLQSFASTLANAEEAYRAQGLSDQDARRKALWPALATGVGTALITRGFGATGIENWTKAISSGAFRETLKEIAKAAGLEGTEEFYDQVQQRLWGELSYQPSANFTQALERTLEEASLAGLSGGIAAGGLRAVTAGSGRRAAEPGAVPPAAPPVAGSTPARRSAAAFAAEQGIPVGAESPAPGAVTVKAEPVQDEQIAHESTESLVARTKVGSERNDAFTKRRQAAIRIASQAKSGDVLVMEDGTRVALDELGSSASGKGEFWAYPEGGDPSKSGGIIDVGAEIQAGGRIERTGKSPKAEPAAPPVVEEIEPFGPLRQFRVTREFYNPADEGTYKVGHIIAEPQLTKAGVAVPEPKAPAPTEKGADATIPELRPGVLPQTPPPEGSPPVETQIRPGEGRAPAEVKAEAKTPEAGQTVFVALRDVGNLKGDEATRLAAFQNLIVTLPKTDLLQAFLEGRIRRVGTSYDGTDYSSRDVDADFRDAFLKLAPDEQKTAVAVALKNQAKKSGERWEIAEEERAVWDKVAKGDALPFAIALADLAANPKEFFSRASGVELSTQLLLPAAPEAGSVSPRFDTVEDVLNYRQQRIADEIKLYQREIGLTEQEATELQSLMRRDVSTSKFEQSLTPETRAALTRFFEESPYNKVGGPFEFWEFDKRLNPEEIAVETDRGSLASALVTAVRIGVELEPTSDRFISAVIAARRLKELGGTQSDIARYIDGYTTREGGSQGGKVALFKDISAKVGAFLRSQGIEFDEGPLGKAESTLRGVPESAKQQLRTDFGELTEVVKRLREEGKDPFSRYNFERWLNRQDYAPEEIASELGAFDKGQSELFSEFEASKIANLKSANLATPTPAPPGERLTIANNKTIELPEFTLEMIRRGSEEAHTGLTRHASVLFSPREKGFLLIKGAGQRAAYRIPLSEIPHEIVKGSINFDKQAVLDFLNDKARRQSAMVDDRNVVHYAPEDIDVIQKPTGRPATGAGAPLGQVTMDPKVLEAIAPAAPGRRPLGRGAMEALGQLERSNPRLAEILERRRPEELDAPFWASIRDEFLKMADRPEYAQPLSGQALALYRMQTPQVERVVNPTNADGLTASIRSLKNRGDITGAQFSISDRRYGKTFGEPMGDIETDNIREVRKLVDDPNSGLTEEQKAVLREILDSPVINYFNGQQLRFRITDSVGEGFSGAYDPIGRMISIVREMDPLSGAHEFFHPLWELIRSEDQRNVRRWRDDAIRDAMRVATGKDLVDLQRMLDGDISSKDFVDSDINRKFYALRSAEEFFAWMLTKRFQQDRQGIWVNLKEAIASQDTFIAKVKAILAVIADSIRQRIPVLRGRMDVLERTILDGKYEVTQETSFRAREPQAALESRENVEKYVDPLEPDSLAKFLAMANVLNKGLVPPALADRFFGLPIGVNLELKDLFTGRIGTHQEGGPAFREVIADQNRTPEERSNYALYAYMEWLGFQSDKAKVIKRRDTSLRKLDELTLKSIEAIPGTNEAEVRAVNSLGGVLDRIKTERESTAEGAQIHERIREGIDHLDALNDLLRQPLAMARALRGIGEVVGRTALLAEHPGEGVLDLISARSGYPTPDTPTPFTPEQWVRGLAHHLDQLRDPEGDRRVNAGEDVIEATLWMLRQRADYKQELLEARMTEDGTLRRFNADYLADLRSTIPVGFEAILKRYATAQAESDALRSAARRLNRRIIGLEERRSNLDQAVEFIRQHEGDREYQDFGKAMQEATGAISGIERTDDGWNATVLHPLTGAKVVWNFGFGKVESVETVRSMLQLAEAGLQYAAQPGANPVKAAFWRQFEENLYNRLLTGNPHYDILKDPLADPVKELTKLKATLLFESNVSKIPGMLATQLTRATQAFGWAAKTENEIAKTHKQRVLNDNEIALRSHKNMTLRQWRDEVAGPIIDSMQHYGQIVYGTGNRIAGFGHVITPEDMKAVRGQYQYDQRLIKLTGGSEKIPAVKEFRTLIKEPEMFRLPLSRGPGTATRFLQDESRRLPAEWRAAVEENQVDRFLNASDNFVRVVIGHVMEDERPYFLLGKGPYAKDYKTIRSNKEELERSGEMPDNLDDLAQMIADLHNEHLARNEPPSTAADVRRALVTEVTSYMKKVSDDTAKKETAANVDVISYENEYTQPRGEKIAPGTLYRYGITDNIDVMRKGNDALEPYVVRVRDYLKLTQNALLAEKDKLRETLNEVYASEGLAARRKAAEIITVGAGADGPSLLQKHQMTMEELNVNIDRIGKLLQNFKDIIRRREEFYGNDLVSQLVKPWADAAIGTVLLAPASWVVNWTSGEVNWGLKLAEMRRGGWLTMPAPLIKAHMKSFMRAVQRQFVPKTERERIIKSLMNDAMDPVAEHFTGLLADIQDWQQMKRSGVVDSYSYKDTVGWDTDRPLGQNLRAIFDSLRDLHAEPALSARTELFNTLGMIPRGWSRLIRKVGMRQVDNSINVQAIAIANGVADMLRKRAIRSFDGRLEHDPVFREVYEEYGDNFKQFALHLAGEHQTGILLTPAELTGRSNPLNMRKIAVQIRRTFHRNNDPVDIIMLKYWWNKRHAGGDRNAPFMTPGQRWALEFTLAEDANMSTVTTRPTWFMGSRGRQMMGALNQWWLWNTDRLRDLYSKVRGQKTYAVRYLPAVIGFLAATAIASLIGVTAGQKANEAAFNTLSKNPGFLDAETDDERLRILTTIAANYWGVIGSLIKMGTDTPGKLGFRNPVFYYNVFQDMLGMASKMYQSGDVTGPALDFLARYSPPLRAVINRLPGREGLVEVRNAANALRAATPESIEAKRRQPSSGNDLRATPMTPLYNTILNAAATGQWDVADEAFAKAVEQSRASGNPNPEQAILSAIRTRAPESAVFSRVLTDGEREQVYGRLTPEGRAQVDKTNSVFDQISSRYGTGGATARAFGGSRFGALPSGSSGALADIGGGFGGSRRLSLGSPRGVRSGFRTRSLRRGLRTRGLRGLRRPRLRSRLRRLAVL